MSVNTHLPGRLRNTPLPLSHGLMPLFEAVVNSIHSIAEACSDPDYGEIAIEILRAPQSALQLRNERAKRGAPAQEPIIGFKVTDNGVGFHDDNMQSFETLDSEYKASQGCRGVGRLLWLKAFEGVNVSSTYANAAGDLKSRTFTFTASRGVADVTENSSAQTTKRQTCVHLSGFKNSYRERSPKTAKTIANSLFEHCLWYFVRDGGAPKITLIDEFERINLDDVYEEYMHSSSQRDRVEVKGHEFEVTHLKLKASTTKSPFVAWCAANRVVEQEGISGKVAGLHGKIKDADGDFIYACYVTSSFLDENVRPERIGFDIEEATDDLFTSISVSLSDIRNAVLSSSSNYLEDYLEENKRAGRERVDNFVSNRAPRYRPILKRIDDSKLTVDPAISDKELDLLLHRQLSEIESSMLAEGHDMMRFDGDESPSDYQARLTSYLAKADDIKKSDLASYVFHRKVVLDILDKAIERRPDGKYAKEELIHELIAPMRKTSDEIFLDSLNLWLIDERLAFHDFLASDKPLSSFPITDCLENKEPDICVLDVFDEPLLVSDSKRMPPAALTIVEIKRPMRNDASQGEEKCPIEQCLGYLQRIRDGKVQTAAGRPIPQSEKIPGFCYVICDLTSSIELRCKIHSLTRAADGLGYFGYNPNFNAYIEVISFDGIVNSARERNRAFFDKLGLPAN
ncbi:ATP-binding protein [Metapseudomonas otitidis]|uniref:ATP-binding protein n=1 Tax=Metapseudomonas otitidis TaxID=319939 RepID=UPI0013F5AD49|nr:ATP-binding protein [Pseudomonas otitidis]